MKNTADIQIRDPFILPVPEEHVYYLFGTTDINCWGGAACGFDCYKSRDLAGWEGPLPAFRPPSGFWGTTNFWAPEVHRCNGRFYMFASFKAAKRYRGTQILSAERPEGPFEPVTDRPITPPDWECLDGTLHREVDGRPWIVFCHEWVQVHNGGMYALPLSADLTHAVGKPVFLFNASEAQWVKSFTHPGWKETSPDTLPPFPCYVTDGPFLHRTAGGVLLMLWSSSGREGYAMGFARSLSGLVTGPWVQQETPLWGRDGGHGMIFRRFDGQLAVTFHTPNDTPNERPVFIEIEETDTGLKLKHDRTDRRQL